MTVAVGGGIFVSYRRQETSHLAGRLYDRLADRFGEGQVFIDVDAPGPQPKMTILVGGTRTRAVPSLLGARTSAPIGVRHSPPHR